ncbi:Gamma-interferon-inducible lysosomal thiol reductase [Glycine max]|nr:Gamma-interferon-inducible lysosomal thiol reductase [Glycine max]
MPDETSALEPPHKYVPWVVVNGEPLYEDYENFLSYLCKAYKGTATPQSCTQASYLREVNAKPKHSVCYKDSGMPTREKFVCAILYSRVDPSKSNRTSDAHSTFE